jgi:hypothetical protein
LTLVAKRAADAEEEEAAAAEMPEMPPLPNASERSSQSGCPIRGHVGAVPSPEKEEQSTTS